ncbi:folylpolyglutamate synthase [Orbilia oligospora]|uniref:Folylpolyglutamate synthase n=2 Tax=Orbilia oligospora TaxID=2813651 RepID=A0A8H2HPM0_ORBOL|nr:folylpolyglutamate synthase [Orbilia oligospora]KAF3240843.1 folylpolyglutamate synthase [Orbilia oligospora]KAF3254422.1 folylpolyglutamate synthase [Orbilia oligospora]KAF3277823.1 folylpolyglutamate synthase [Orbilia oligospora]TGJ66916.1 folylpolyglutamate synthase [Orbilia oligospora]
MKGPTIPTLHRSLIFTLDCCRDNFHLKGGSLGTKVQLTFHAMLRTTSHLPPPLQSHDNHCPDPQSHSIRGGDSQSPPSVLPSSKMGIDLTLSRVIRLIPSSSLAWRALHVAGTNGKGSVCAYLSSALTSSGIRTGRFTSPHLVDRWDSIALNDKTIDSTLFHETEALVKKRNQDGNIGATEFELLTATAFEIFSKEKVELAVVEVGLGGRLDATNLIKDPLVTVLTKIGMDHVEFLGDTVEKIAREKAGIMKPGAPCVVDASNVEGVLNVINEVKEEVGAGEIILAAPEVDDVEDVPPSGDVPAPLPTTTPSPVKIKTPIFGLQSYAPSLLGKYQHSNLACAIHALSVTAKTYPQITAETVKKGVSEAKNPGRLQWITVKSSIGKKQEMIIDGAHNSEAAVALGQFVDENLRARIQQRNVTWVVGISHGKDVPAILGEFLKEGDVVSTVEFGPVDGMPWVKAEESALVAKEAEKLVGPKGLVRSWGSDLKGAVQWSCEVGCEGPIVIAGSLYLAGDVTRLSKIL